MSEFLGAGVLDAPAWNLDALAAAQAWQWLGGWRPELLPAYMTLGCDVPDPDLLIELLLVIRKHAHG